jgi:DTW domain-containing protein YfiP
VANRVRVLVLQHPDEATEAKGSVRLMALALTRCRVVMGERFEDHRLRELLGGGGVCSTLLYPGPGGAPVGDGPGETQGDSFRQLVVLDGTWRKSVRMLANHPLLQSLPRLELTPTEPRGYASLRQSRSALQLSTLEATCAALGLLEGNGGMAAYRPLLDAFGRFVDASLARRPPMKNAVDPGG